MEHHNLENVKIHQFNIAREVSIDNDFYHRKNPSGGSIHSIKLKKWEIGSLDFIFSELGHN